MEKELYAYLEKTYKKSEPIFLCDICVEGMGKNTIGSCLRNLIRKGLVVRYIKGVYYLPAVTILGTQSTLINEEVIIAKYVSRKGQKIFGFITGASFANGFNLTTQVPYVYEIVSNKATTKIREVYVRNSKVILKKPRVEITEDNCDTVYSRNTQ